MLHKGLPGIKQYICVSSQVLEVIAFTVYNIKLVKVWDDIIGVVTVLF